MKKNSLLAFAALLFLVVGNITYFACGGRKQDTGKTASPSRWTFDTSLQAWQSRDTAWENYRQRFQGHFQMIGLQSFDDGSHLLIISEPPPHVSLEALQDSFAPFNYRLEVKTDTIGEDGWVKDLVVAIADAPLFEVVNLIRRLNTLFYESDYHADIFLPLPIAPKRDYFLADNLNYQVTLPEIRKWFLEDHEPILTTDADTTHLTALLEAKATGVYFSKKPGFLIWIIERSADLSKNKDDIRRFALDADLVLGAVANSSCVAVIGRERINSIVDLPPLRTETICMLAATQKSELAQSYERTMFMAGKLPDGSDWAPIFLSDELKNTEYGSLLNITDQMLKSWSCNGQIAYKHWKHPAPSHFVFKRNGLMDEMGGEGSVTFNWNTKGAAYSAQQGDLDIVALNRTGSLPVSYIPESMKGSGSSNKFVGNFETKGYDFFSSLNNPDLIRVVQYGFLYQIFDKFDINSSNQNVNSKLPIVKSPVKEKSRQRNRERQENAKEDIIPEANPLIRPYTTAINKIAGLGHQEIEDWSRQMVEDIDTKLGEGMGAQFKPIALQHSSSMCDIVKQVKDKGELEAFISALASPREQQQEREAIQPYVEAFLNHTFPLAQCDYASYLGVNFTDVFTWCKSAWGKSESPWIKTPTVVVSWNTKERFLGLGGHNLGAHVTPFIVDPKLPTGRFRVEEGNGGRNIFVSKNDYVNVNPAMIQAAKVVSQGSWKDIIPNWTKKIRERRNVFSELDRERGIRVEKIAANTFKVNNIRCETRIEFEATLTKEARESKEGVQYHFEKFSEEEIMATLKTQEIRETGRLSQRGFADRITQESFDFENATYKSFPKQGKVVVDIPAKKGFWLRAKITISRLAQNMVTKAETTIQKALDRCKNNRERDLEEEFFKEWEQEGFRGNPSFRKEFFDVIIGQVEEFKPLPMPDNLRTSWS